MCGWEVCVAAFVLGGREAPQAWDRDDICAYIVVYVLTLSSYSHVYMMLLHESPGDPQCFRPRR